MPLLTVDTVWMTLLTLSLTLTIECIVDSADTYIDD